MIKLRARDVERIFPAVPRLIREIEIADLFTTPEHRAGLVDEMLRLNGIEQPDLFEQIHRARQQTFTDDEAREVLFLDDEHAKAVTMQTRRRHRARRASADDQNVRVGVVHDFKHSFCAASVCNSSVTRCMSSASGRSHFSSGETPRTNS